MLSSRGILVVAIVLLAGCSMPKTQVYEPNTGMGRKFCAELAETAQKVSTQEMAVGIFMLVLGGSAMTASGVLSTINGLQDESNEVLGYIAGGLAVAPLIAVPVSMIMLSRSDENSAMSAAANTALVLADTDEEAHRDCVLAKAAWVGSRTDAMARAREALAEEKEKKEKEEKEKKEAAGEAEVEVEGSVETGTPSEEGEGGDDKAEPSGGDKAD